MPENRGPVLALLRGINVGGRSMLSMSELRAALDAAGPLEMLDESPG